MPDQRKSRYPGCYPSGKAGWQYKIRLPPDPVTGVRHWETRGGFTTDYAAHQARSRRLVELGQGINTAPSGLTVTQAVEAYIAGRHMKPNSRYNYTKLLERYITPYIGTIPVADLTPARVRQWRETLATTGKRRGSGGLAISTINLTRGLLASAFHQLHRDGGIARNVVALVEGLPTDKHTPDTWNDDEIRRFLAISDTDEYAALWRLCLFSLLRPGEVIALRWDDIDLTARTVTIRQTLTRDVDGVAAVGRPKTRASAAAVGFSPETAGHLQRLQDTQRLTARTRPDGWRTDLVFPNRNGRMMPTHAQLNARLQKLCECAGVPRLSAHKLRHSGSSAMIRAGVDPTTLSRLLRHQRPDYSLRLYTHARLEHVQEAVSRLEDRISSGSKDEATKTG